MRFNSAERLHGDVNPMHKCGRNGLGEFDDGVGLTIVFTPRAIFS